MKYYNYLKPFRFLLFFFFMIGPIMVFGQDPFITIWKTDNPGYSADDEIIIQASGDYNYYWEEVGKSSNNGTGSASSNKTIKFPSPGTYRVKITPDGSTPFHRLKQHQSISEDEKPLSVEQWGDVEWSSFENAFKGYKNLTINATDIPNLSNVTNMARAFESTAISSVPHMNDWDVSHVENMSRMFSEASSFNQNISDWDVSNVTEMSSMFYEASSFNQDIGSWDVSKVKRMLGMFNGASAFNKDIGDWDVSHVEMMLSMFSSASSFNQDIGNWDVSNVKHMSNMFNGASSFNQDIGNWDVSHGQYMIEMFKGASNFNQDIGDWNVSHVQNMDGMFEDASNFNQDISNWDILIVKKMSSMFKNAYDFNQSLANWDLINVEEVENMLDNSGVDCENYSATLYSWANNPQTASDLNFGAVNILYSPDVKDERDHLINDLGWSINGDLKGNCSLSNDSHTLTNITLYPNPTTDQINLNGLQGDEQIQVFNMQGKLVKQAQAPQTSQVSLNIENLDAGIYFIKIFNSEGTSLTKKLIKK